MNGFMGILPGLGSGIIGGTYMIPKFHETIPGISSLFLEFVIGFGYPISVSYHRGLLQLILVIDN